jgi:hypothetical protein
MIIRKFQMNESQQYENESVDLIFICHSIVKFGRILKVTLLRFANRINIELKLNY